MDDDHAHPGGHGHGHGHGHGVTRETDRRLLLGALGLLLALLVGEAVAGLASGSLALLSDAGHLLTDVGALGAALIAMRLAARPASDRWTYGLRRAEIVSAAVNGLTLLTVAALIAVEATRRLVDPPPVSGGVVVAVAAVGCAVNLLATRLLARANRTSLNIEGAYRHVLTDLVGFLGTLVAGAVVWATGWSRADAIASLVVAALMLWAGGGLVASACRILLEGTPSGMDPREVRTHLEELDDVQGVHDLHLWALNEELVAVSAHVVVGEECFASGRAAQVLDELQACLGSHFAVGHTTLQLEFPRHAAHEMAHCR